MPSAGIILPTHQTAVIVQGPGKLKVQRDVPVPAPSADMALVKTAAVAINPVDAKMLDYSPAPGAVHGYDFAGTVVALGADAPAHLTVGDRVAGMVHGNNSLRPDIGAFSEYVGAGADLLLRLPDGLSFEEGAGLGIGMGTALLCLFRELEVPGSLERAEVVGDHSHSSSAEDENNQAAFVLVAGGSTATGTRAIQLLKLAGLRPIATCSPLNFDLALAFGAEKVFDYRSPTCAADIRAYTRNTLAYALDCVSQADTTQLCYAAIGRAGGRYVSLEPYRETVVASRPTVNPSFVMFLAMFGRKVALDGVYGREARPADRTFGAHMFEVVQGLMDRGLMRAHPVKAMRGGWDGVIMGVEMIGKHTMSGYKLVYRV